MFIKQLTLRNFRNYINLNLELPLGWSIFFGGNAQGKTNLLEAIYFLSTTRSPRTSNERELLNQAMAGEFTATYLSTEVVKAKGNLKIEIGMRLEKGKDAAHHLIRKRFQINGITRRAVDLIGQLIAVMFSAQDIELINGPPILRRRYLDIIGSQLNSRYLFSLQRYQRVLEQRNRLLKLLSEEKAHLEQLDFWDKELVENGAYIIQQRQIMVEEINQLIAGIYAELSGGEGKLNLIYLPSLGEATYEVERQFATILHQLRRKEIIQGMSLAGPHRDDLRFSLDGMDLNAYGSRGQQRSAALSLRLAEANYLQLKTQEPPILLLDDVLSELDQNRRTALLEFISPFQQGLITTTELDYFETFFLARSAKFKVSGGAVFRLETGIKPIKENGFNHNITQIKEV